MSPKIHDIIIELQIVAMIHDCHFLFVPFIMIFMLGEFEAHVCLVQFLLSVNYLVHNTHTF